MRRERGVVMGGPCFVLVPRRGAAGTSSAVPTIPGKLGAASRSAARRVIGPTRSGKQVGTALVVLWGRGHILPPVPFGRSEHTCEPSCLFSLRGAGAPAPAPAVHDRR